jgi:hypothetical protein
MKMSRLSRSLQLAGNMNGRLKGEGRRRCLSRPRRSGRRQTLELALLEDRIVPALFGQQLFPLDNALNQNISNAPVAANSAAIIANIGASTRLTPNWTAADPSLGSSPLYGFPFNVVHGNSTAKVNVIIDNYPGESDIEQVPIPANAVLEGDYQNGPNPNGAGYNVNQRGDSDLIVWDEDNNIAYELYGVSRPSDPALFPNTSDIELPHADGLWHAAQESVWNMNTNSFRTLGETSAEASGLSILAGLARPDEALPVSQGGQGVIDHALAVTLPAGDINPQYIYPASHMLPTSQSPDNLPLGSRLRLANTPAIDALISNMPPESQVLATAMQRYGLIVAGVGNAMYVSGTPATVDTVDSPSTNLTWDLNDIFASNGLESLNAGDFQVVNLTPVVTGLSASSAAAGSSIIVNGQNFSGAARNLSVFFGSTAASSVTVLSDMQLSVVVPSGSGTVDVTVQSGINETDTLSSNPNANVNAPIFGYGTSAKTPADMFTFTANTFVPVSISGNVFNDLNGDGTQESGEPGLQGWEVQLVNSSNTIVSSVVTDSNGNYMIPNVGPGTFTLQEVLQPGYVQKAPAPPGTYTFTTSSGTNIAGDTFGDVMMPVSTTTAVSSSVNPSVFAQPIMLVAQVTPGVSGSGTPKGSVTFYNGTVALQTVPLINGDASMTISSFVLGTHTITARYSGDSNFKSSVSAALDQVVKTVALQSDASDPSQQDLVVGGTADADLIAIKTAGTGKVTVDVDQLAGGHFEFAQKYTVSGLARLVVYGGPGRNIITVDDAVALPAVLLGGGGDNFIKGGGGPSVLVGGPVSDILVGALGRSIVIGGGGADILTARGDAVLISGSTTYDTNLIALDAILAEWSRTNASYQTRVNNLIGPSAGGTAGGLNGPYYFNPITVSSDGAKNILVGGSGPDLFFAGVLDSVFGKKAGEKEVLV